MGKIIAGLVPITISTAKQIIIWLTRFNFLLSKFKTKRIKPIEINVYPVAKGISLMLWKRFPVHIGIERRIMTVSKAKLLNADIVFLNNKNAKVPTIPTNAVIKWVT